MNDCNEDEGPPRHNRSKSMDQSSDTVFADHECKPNTECSELLVVSNNVCKKCGHQILK